MKKVLIIGGAGYIGAHVAQTLTENGYAVRIFDDFSNGLWRRIEGKFDDVIVGDVLNRPLLVSAMDNVDSVIHLAAKKSVEESVTNPLKYFENNVGGTLNLLAAMSAKKVRRLVFSSTAAVYAPSQEVLIQENHPLNPVSPYGETKLISENLVKIVGFAEGISTVSLRYFNVAGSLHIEFGDNSKDNIIPKVFAAVKNGKEPEIYGIDYPTRDGTCIRDYIHVGDVADSHLLALKRVEHSMINEVYNVGSGNGYSVQEIMNQISESIGIVFKPVHAPRRAGDTPQLVASISKIENELNWRPKRSLKEMIDSAWESEVGTKK
jgi:UDP-glucose 4-epimerase